MKQIEKTSVHNIICYNSGGMNYFEIRNNEMIPIPIELNVYADKLILVYRWLWVELTINENQKYMLFR